MENRNREMPEEKHLFGPSWKLPHDLKAGIREINTFSAKSESSCRNYHPLWKPELRKDVSCCYLLQGRSTPTLPPPGPLHRVGVPGAREGRRLQTAEEWTEENNPGRYSTPHRSILRFSGTHSCSRSSSVFP